MDRKGLRAHDLLWISQDSQVLSPEQPQWVEKSHTNAGGCRATGASTVEFCLGRG